MANTPRFSGPGVMIKNLSQRDIRKYQ
jgi:hypothetical protein